MAGPPARTLRVAIFKKGVATIGGSEAYARALARGLAARGHDVRVVGLRPPWRRAGLEAGPAWRDGDVAVRLLPGRLGRLAAAADALLPTQLVDEAAAREALRGADVVHTFNREYMHLAERICAAAGARHVTTPLIHPGQPFAGTAGQDIAVYRRASAVLALTQWEAAWYAAHGVPRQRLHVVGAGAHLVPDRATPREPHTVLFVGRRERYKGYFALAAAAPLVWRELPQARFLVVGQRAWYGALEGLLTPASDPRWEDLGTSDEAGKARAYARAAILCMPSVHETFGQSFVEAWLAGCAVIGADTPVAREVLAGAGQLVRQDPRAIAAAILRLLSVPGLAEELARRGQERTADLGWEAVSARVEAAYLAALDASA